ncbi:immunoglobulin superfamily member 1-like [Numida meleagris]|uniref:immunoglobulin superfamily member 1-like n=1 Tax=Numida meleagris TaxID=8996 RepID=UPI000B3DEB2F|nr:immunoglobulin superfamily member 1-like [Numida meleagris]
MALALILVSPDLVPRPSLSLHPSQEIQEGDNVTLRCHLPWPDAWVQLCQERAFISCMEKYVVQDVAVFSFVITKWVHTGTYRCQYWLSEPAETSEKSDPVELVVTDHTFPPPPISLSPEGRVGIGTNVTIRCRNWYHGATFLHKDGYSAPIQRQDPDDGGIATFTLFQVTPADSGTYRCSYHPKGYPFLSSPLGKRVTLQVTHIPTPPSRYKTHNLMSPVSSTVGSVSASSPQGGGGWGWEHPNTQMPQDPTAGSRGNLVVAVVRCCAAAFVFGLGVFFVVDARSLWIRRDESPGGEGVEWI